MDGELRPAVVSAGNARLRKSRSIFFYRVQYGFGKTLAGEGGMGRQGVVFSPILISLPRPSSSARNLHDYDRFYSSSELVKTQPLVADSATSTK